MKISQEHLEKLQEIQRNSSSIKIQIAEVTIDIAGLKSRQKHLLSISSDLSNQEEEFSMVIRETYGDVKSINFQTGEFEL